MTSFQNIPEEFQRLYWLTLRDGWISLYWKTEVLEKDLEWFKKENYAIAQFDCTTWISEKEMHKQLKMRFNFPDYYGENFDALNDCLSYIDIINTGLIVTFRHLDNCNFKLIHTLLDVFADNARRQMLYGKRLIILIQVSNRKFQINNVGANNVILNHTEWLESTKL